MDSKYQRPGSESSQSSTGSGAVEMQHGQANVSEGFHVGLTHFSGHNGGAKLLVEQNSLLPTADTPILPVEEGRRRAVIENVAPQIDEGRVFINRTVGETVTVEADIY